MATGDEAWWSTCWLTEQAQPAEATSFTGADDHEPGALGRGNKRMTRRVTHQLVADLHLKELPLPLLDGRG
jgi:hypothetical protein